MAKYLRINDFRDVTPSGFDGHKYRLNFDIGDHKSDVFTSELSSHSDIEISGTLETIWGLDPVRTREVIGSICLSNILELAKNDELDSLQLIKLNTFSSGKIPPSDLYSITKDTIISFAPKVKKVDENSSRMSISILSEDISKIRDQINALSKSLLGENLLLLKQERALIDMYKSPNSDVEFERRISSLAGLIALVNKDLIRNKLGISKDDNFGWRKLLEELLKSYSDDVTANDICNVFKNINDLRQGYPTHGDNLDNVLPAYNFFGLVYPIDDFVSAWEIILKRYFDVMKKFREVLKSVHNNN